jgi:cellulose synthase/poly-beta-1,6-N-acetylglucosamine synthase-like glycosyltransferase
MFSGFLGADVAERRTRLEKRYRATSGLFAISIITALAIIFACTGALPRSTPAAFVSLAGHLRDSSLAGFILLVWLFSAAVAWLVSAVQLAAMNRLISGMRHRRSKP